MQGPGSSCAQALECLLCEAKVLVFSVRGCGVHTAEQDVRMSARKPAPGTWSLSSPSASYWT